MRKPECSSSVQAVLGSRRLDKAQQFPRQRCWAHEFQNSCDASQLEQNMTQANIGELRQNKGANTQSLLLSMDWVRHRDTNGREAGPNLFSGHNLY